VFFKQLREHHRGGFVKRAPPRCAQHGRIRLPFRSEVLFLENGKLRARIVCRFKRCRGLGIVSRCALKLAMLMISQIVDDLDDGGLGLFGLSLAPASLQGGTRGSFGFFIRRSSSRGDHPCLERAGRCQSADRCLRYVEAPSHVCLRFAIRKPLHSFPPLMRRQSCRSPEFHTTGLCSGSALSCAGDD
jgi:hypothetical protein